MGHFLDEYLKTLSTQRWELSEKIIREENVNRKTPLSFPTAPPVYANTEYENLKLPNGKPFKRIPIKGKEIGIEIEGTDEKYKSLFPAPLIILDEAYKEFPKSKPLPDGQLEFLMECRHYYVIMLLAAPRAVLLNKDIRASGSRFIEPRKVINEKDAFGRLCKTTWECREFLESNAIEEYISTDGKSDGYIETTYVHKGNIRDICNSYAFAHRFFPKEGKNFET